MGEGKTGHTRTASRLSSYPIREIALSGVRVRKRERKGERGSERERRLSVTSRGRTLVRLKDYSPYLK